MLSRFPSSDLDRPDKLLASAGSFWSETYAGVDLVASVLSARAALDRQTLADTEGLLDALSRFSLPVFHRDIWSLLALRESERQTGTMPSYDGTHAYGDGAEYGVPAPGVYCHWPAPPGLARARVLLNRVSDASLTLTTGVDFFLAGGRVYFASDPFASDLLVKKDVYAGDQVVDREVGLWLYGGLFDRDAVHRQIGYVLGQRLASSGAAKDFLNATLDAIVEGTTCRSTDAALAAICDVPLAREEVEVVEEVEADSRGLWVVTDRHAYGFSAAANAVVRPGDSVRAGDPLTDALLCYEFNRGQVPTAAQVGALSLGPGLLADGYLGELVFSNADVPLEVSTADDGHTVVEFAVSGWPGDVRKFWADVDAAGVASGRTLAMRLDRRGPAAAGQPSPLNLPATINPLGFLLQNVFRGSLTIAVVRTQALGPDALGLHHTRALRKVVPPHTALVVAARLEIGPEQINMTGPGAADAPGYGESARTYLGESVAGAIDPSLVSESARARQIHGRCE